jgi:CheY-like chemotaxis protein
MNAHDDRVRKLAYHLWEDSGRCEGNALKFWLLAEQLVIVQEQVQSNGTKPSCVKPLHLLQFSPKNCADLASSNIKNPVRGPMVNRAVVVDENASLNRVVGLVLQSLGAKDIVLVKRGEEALSYLQDSLADLIILDRISDISGALECTQRIRTGSGRANQNIPIILLSEERGRGSAEAAYAAGVDLILKMPLSIRDLSAGINTSFLIASRRQSRGHDNVFYRG